MDDPFTNKQNVHISTEQFDRKMIEFSLLLYNNPLLSRKAVDDIWTMLNNFISESFLPFLQCQMKSELVSIANDVM